MMAFKRSNLSDPVAHFWRTRAARGSEAGVFSRMSLTDRSEVASKCFKDANFDVYGKIACFCDLRRSPASNSKRLSYCSEEYLCETLATNILMPTDAFIKDITEMLEDRFDPEQIIKVLSRKYILGAEVDLRALGKQWGLFSIVEEDIDSDAILLPHRGEFTVMLRKFTDEAGQARQRFSLAHEIGHLMLKTHSSDLQHRGPARTDSNSEWAVRFKLTLLDS